MGRAEWNALFAVGAVVFILGLKLASRDDPPPQDADLIPVENPAASADDAYPVFLKLNAAFPLTPDERTVLNNHFNGKISSETAVAGFIARSTEALALFGDLSRRSTLSDSNYRDLSTIGPETPVPSFYAVVDTAKMSSLQSDSLLKKGRGKEALAQALTIVDVGRLFARGHPQLIEELVGMLLMDIGAKRASAIVASGKVERAFLPAAAASLSAPTNTVAGLQEGLRFAYVVQLHTLDHIGELAVKGQGNPSLPRNLMIASASRGGWYLYMPHRTRALFAERFRGIIAEMGKPCNQARTTAPEPLPVGLRPNMVGRILYDIAFPDYGKLAIRRCETDYRVTSAAAAAALQAYRVDHGGYPASLSELTPNYLAAPPVDPFSGAALLYSADTGEIHTAGKTLDGKPL